MPFAVECFRRLYNGYIKMKGLTFLIFEVLLIVKEWARGLRWQKLLLWVSVCVRLIYQREGNWLHFRLDYN